MSRLSPSLSSIRVSVEDRMDVIKKWANLLIGIAWFAVALIPIMFELVGLGTNHVNVRRY